MPYDLDPFALWQTGASLPSGRARPLWEQVRSDAVAMARAEPLMSDFVTDQILAHTHFESALGHIVAGKLAGGMLRPQALRALAAQAMAADPGITAAMQADIEAVCERDPASSGPAEPLLFYKGVHALAAYRLAHWLWGQGRRSLARCLQSRSAECLGVDIHPGARIGRGILLDHAHGVVIGETAVIEDDVSILHNVTLGGTGKHGGDRHPKVRSGVLLGAGALILGNIEIGRGAKIGAGSVVMRAVPPQVTVAGGLARTVGVPASAQPSREMNHLIEAAPAAPEPAWPLQTLLVPCPAVRPDDSHPFNESHPS